MEKLLYPLWKPAAQGSDDFRDTLLQASQELGRVAGVHAIRLCAADSAVAPAAGRRIENHAPVPDAMLSLWVDSAGAAAGWEPLIDACVDRKAAYLVAEAEPLVVQAQHPSRPGERVYGMCHVVFMSPPASMDRQDWLAVWKDSHTQVAIDTQSTFGYRQNVVVRELGGNIIPCYAIVEENFPPEAMTSDHAFYATGGDEAVLQRNMTAMIESCSRFIDFEQIDVIPMSEYLVKPLV
ncbi:MAG: EthD domain-containing protein [Halioglobus sp.]|nr:EthD domain-containing protein [Halioglobus sp.]